MIIYITFPTPMLIIIIMKSYLFLSWNGPDIYWKYSSTPTSELVCYMYRHKRAPKYGFIRISEFCPRSSNCFLNMFHQIQDYLQFITLKVPSDRGGLLLSFLPPSPTYHPLPHTHTNFTIITQTYTFHHFSNNLRF